MQQNLVENSKNISMVLSVLGLKVTLAALNIFLLFVCFLKQGAAKKLKLKDMMMLANVVLIKR